MALNLRLQKRKKEAEKRGVHVDILVSVKKLDLKHQLCPDYEMKISKCQVEGFRLYFTYSQGVCEDCMKQTLTIHFLY